MKHVTLPLFALALAALTLVPVASHAGNCDTLRERIAGKLRASGVDRFSLVVADTDARVAGKVVGSCDLGTKKIVYSQAGAPASAASTATRQDEPMLTECKDGSVSRGGNCRP